MGEHLSFLGWRRAIKPVYVHFAKGGQCHVRQHLLKDSGAWMRTRSNFGLEAIYRRIAFLPLAER